MQLPGRVRFGWEVTLPNNKQGCLFMATYTTLGGRVTYTQLNISFFGGAGLLEFF